MREALESFLSELKGARRFSPHTLAAYRGDVTRVLDLAAGEARPVRAEQWDQALLERALRELFRTGHAASSTARALAAWRSFGRFCVRRGLFATDPARALAFPRLPRRLPRTLPRQDLNDALDRLASAADPVAARDLALLEMTYSAGLRLSELVGLHRGDLDRGGRSASRRWGSGRSRRSTATWRSRGASRGRETSHCFLAGPARVGALQRREARPHFRRGRYSAWCAAASRRWRAASA